MGVLFRTSAEELLLDGGSSLSTLPKFLVDVCDRSVQILGAVSCTVSLHTTCNGLKVHTHVDLGLCRSRRGETSEDGLRVLIAHESSAHSWVRPTDHDPRRLGGCEGVVDVRAGELLGENNDILEGLFGVEPFEDLGLGVYADGDVSRSGIAVCQSFSMKSSPEI